MIKNFKKFAAEHKKLVLVFGGLSLVLIVAAFFYLRYPFAYNAPNFYAEDGTIFTKNVLEKGPLVAIGTLFNGYLVVGQYLLTDLAIGISYAFGHGFVTIPKGIAVVSYLFWGFICVLPFLLFRKQLGLLLGILTICVLAVVPLGGYDYATIGTIGNLKFAFFFVALLLMIYRHQTGFEDSKKRAIITDMALLICVFTNILVLALLPFGLLKYHKIIKTFFTNIKMFVRSLRLDFVSFMVLALVSTIYVFIVYKLGIPAMPGYLDTPLRPEALIDVGYRGSVYGILFPINLLMNDIVAVILMIGVVVFASINKQRVVLLFSAFAIFVNVFGFVLNRPGVTEFFQSYTIDGGPGHFFYAGTMIFVFAFAYQLKDWFKRKRLVIKIVASVAVLVFVVLAFPFSGSGGLSYTNIISKKTTIGTEVDKVCATKVAKIVELNVYPSDGWVLKLPNDVVCDRK